jgi:hypothetical protein
MYRSIGEESRSEVLLGCLQVRPRFYLPTGGDQELSECDTHVPAQIPDDESAGMAWTMTLGRD